MKKVVIGIILALIAAAMFLPMPGSTQIRNIPWLIAVAILILAALFVCAVRYVVFMFRAKRTFEEKGFKCVRFAILPLTSKSKGRYNLVFKGERGEIGVILLAKKKKYQQCYFKEADQIEFYITNRVVFKSSNAKGANITNMLETKLVGKKRIKWNQSDDDMQRREILLFDRFPDKITDSVKRDIIGNGDRICKSNARVYDLQGLQNAEI